MLNRSLPVCAGVLFLGLFLSGRSTFADAAFVPNLGIEYRFAGGSWMQTDPKDAFDPSVTMGAGLVFEALTIGNHRLGIGAGYLAHLRPKTAGTAQITVKTFHQQTDFSLIYRYHWDYVTLAGAVGASMAVLSVTTRIYNVGPPDVSEDGETYIYNDKTLADETTAAGAIWGPTVTGEVGLDIGRTAFRGLARFDNFLFMQYLGSL